MALLYPSTCQFPGCSKIAFQGGAYCSRSHRDAMAPPQGGSSWQSNLKLPSNPFRSRTPVIYTEESCQTPGCSKPVHPGSKYCSRTHRDNAIYGPQPASTSVQKLRTPQVENGYHTENENKVLQKHQRRRTSSFSAQPIPYKRPYNPNEILFYDQAKKYYEFTNFSPHPIRYNMKDYPSSEHLFQSLKFMDPKDSEFIRMQPDPRSAFNEAHRLRSRVRKDWISGKVNIKMMEKIILLKFTQHDDLREMLLGTGGATLVEDSPVDPFWGTGSDGKGQNELGKALEKIRGMLREAE